IAFDNDEAGNEASFKSAEVLRQVGCVVKIATLKEGQDPDDMLRKEGRKAFFQNVIMTSKRMEDSFIEYTKGKYDVTLPHESFLFVREVLDELSSENISEQYQLIKKLEGVVDIPLQTMIDVIKERGG